MESGWVRLLAVLGAEMFIVVALFGLGWMLDWEERTREKGRKDGGS
jgi:hypothetical protein